ncbi:hypothetical protein OWV82_012880, partial [Melia azedarach]
FVMFPKEEEAKGGSEAPPDLIIAGSLNEQRSGLGSGKARDA